MSLVGFFCAHLVRICYAFDFLAKYPILKGKTPVEACTPTGVHYEYSLTYSYSTKDKYSM